MNMNDLPPLPPHPFIPENPVIPETWDLDIPVIDIHAHVYPQKIAAKAVDSVGDFYCYHDMFGAGTPEDLLDQQRFAPITRFVIHSVATSPKHVPTINNFITQTAKGNPAFVGFATIHPDCEDMETAVEEALAMGAQGFKIHPDTQCVDMDDPHLMEFYEIIAGRVPLIMHAGDYRYDYSSPLRLKKVLRAFPNLVIDAAHLGGWSIYDVAFDVLHKELLANENLFVDSSSSFLWIGQRHMGELINKWGADRVLFGSDYPLGNPPLELALMLGVDLTDDQLEQVLYKNAERFLGFSPLEVDNR